MNLADVICSRRSIRKFLKKSVPDLLVNEILDAGRWAPSGLNNQPWRFAVIRDMALKDKLSALTTCSDIVSQSDFCIAVFYHTPSGYNRDKDIMSIGACIQNMLLYSHDRGLGSVWLGEILKNRDKINKLLNIDTLNEFMALIAFGYPDEKPESERQNINEMILKIL
mgnify:CR=1 FL=1